MVKFSPIIKRYFVKIVMSEVTFLTAFIAGLLSFLSPCVLPLLPGYLSFISGESIETLTSENAKSVRLKAFLGAVFFGLGFTLVFVILGASATSIGGILKEYKFVLGKVAGAVIIILGLHMFGVFKIKFLLMQKKWNYSKKGNSPFYIEAFVLGVAFVFGWTPCIGPALAAILSLASQEDTLLRGIQLLITFGLGLWIPFLLSALSVGFVVSFIRKAGRIVVIVEKVSGVLLIIIGLMMVTGKLEYVSRYLIQWFPFLADINF